MSDSRTGYVYRQLVYTGKRIDGATKQGSLGNKVVCGLLKEFEGQGHRLYTDNFYMKPDLFLQLFDHGIYTCGTMRKYRKGFLQELQLTPAQERRTEMGKIDWNVSYRLLCVTWMNKLLVRVISTIDPLKNNDHWSQIRISNEKERIIVDCPVAVRDYNIYMRGVDREDQLISLTTRAGGPKSGGNGCFGTILRRSSSIPMSCIRA